MKKKILAILLIATLTLSLVACGGSSSDSGNEETQQTESEEKKEDVVEDDGIIDFECDSFKITYTRHEVSTDWEGNPCLIYYFNFTNKGDEATSAMVTSYIQCFQNGVECETAILDGDNEAYDNYSKDIQKDVTIEACNVFKLDGTSEVTLEASDWTSLSDEKDTQKITLE